MGAEERFEGGGDDDGMDAIDAVLIALALSKDKGQCRKIVQAFAQGVFEAGCSHGHDMTKKGSKCCDCYRGPK